MTLKFSGKTRIQKALNFEEADKVGKGDSFWVETLERWQKEGMDKEVLPYKYFEFDYSHIMFDQRIGFKEKIIKEQQDCLIMQHIDGGIFKVPKNKQTFIRNEQDLPGIPIDYKIKTYQDWKTYKKKFVPDKWRLALQPELSGRFGSTQKDIPSLLRLYRDISYKDMFIFFAPREGVENIRTKLGTENFMMQMALNPKWMMEMFEADVNLTLEMYRMYDELDIEFDGLWVWGDIAYNKGPFFSPETYRKVVMPFHKKLFSYFREKNMPVVYHTDGNCTNFLPLLIESGITAIQPLEVKAGMDGIEIKKKYGKNLAIVGNIDARVMSEGRDAIKKEISSKIPVLKKGGGYIYHSDHSVPYTVSLNYYKYVLECLNIYGSY